MRKSPMLGTIPEVSHESGSTSTTTVNDKGSSITSKPDSNNEKLKQANEDLNKLKLGSVPSTSKISSMSSRTKLALEENEKLKREISEMNKARSKEKEKMRYLEQERANSTKARLEQIQNLIQRAQELDVAFLIDATSSMQPSIDMVKNEISAMAEGIRRSYPQCKLRFALAIYRDYDDPKDPEDGCDFTSNYDRSNSEFSRALARIVCKGGADAAEDVFTGLETTASLDWQSTNRLLVHIADAPCHGSQFHDMGRGGDNYPDGDKYGRKIGAIVQKLRETCHISLYCFCHLTEYTVKMLKEFKKAAGDDSWVEEWHPSDLSKVPDKVVAASRITISKSLSVLQSGGPADLKFVKEIVVEKSPSWSGIATQEGEEYIHRGDGAVRWPYHALVSESGDSDSAREVVVKRFKTPFGKSPQLVHAKECYVSQMEVQTVAKYMAEEFNKRTAHLTGARKIQYTVVSLLQAGSKFYTMENLLRGEWTRYSNNGEYVNMTDYAATLQAFSHWTYHASEGLLMVTDLQGVKQRDEDVPGKHIFVLWDPAIHTNNENVMRFTRTNLGEKGFSLFLDNHLCNDVCRHLCLPEDGAGHTFRGTKVTF